MVISLPDSWKIISEEHEHEFHATRSFIISIGTYVTWLKCTSRDNLHWWESPLLAMLLDLHYMPSET